MIFHEDSIDFLGYPRGRGRDFSGGSCSGFPVLHAGAQYQARRRHGKHRYPSVGRRCLIQRTISYKRSKTQAPQDPSLGDQLSDVSTTDASLIPRRRNGSEDLRRQFSAGSSQHLPSGAMTASNMTSLRREIRQDMQ